MGKVGRPKKPAALEMVVSCRLTQAEYHWLHDQARKHRCSVADLLREVVLADMPRGQVEPEPPADAGERLDNLLSRHPWG